MQKRKIFGNLGEEIACKYLLNKKYQIIQRNYQKKWGEIDIIAKDPNGILIFVEVKTSKQNSEITPEMEITQKKLKRLKRACSLYAGKYQEKVSDLGWRIDLIAITFVIQTSLEKSKGSIKHYKNIIG